MTTRYEKGVIIQERFFVLDVVEGGIGEVYLCIDGKKTRACALKYLKADIADRHKRVQNFKQTCTLHLSLGKHPNIVHGIDYLEEEADETPYMVLEWVTPEQDRGVELSEWIALGALDLRTTLDFAMDICAGMIYATKHQLIAHRDLKPDNILIGRGRIAKITDFGLAYSTDVKGQGRGTTAYMAPEMWNNTSRQDHRVDIYAIGCILYEMAEGKKLFDSDNIEEIYEMHHSGKIKWETDSPLYPIILKCLALNPDDRYLSFDALQDALRQLYIETYQENPRVHEVAESKVDELLDRALAYKRVGSIDNLQKACDDLTEAIRLDPNNGELFSYRALFYSQMSRDEEALLDLGDALRLLPEDNSTNYLAGLVYINIKLYEKGLAYFEETLKNEPNHWRARANLGMCLYQLDRDEEASVTLSQALNIEESDELFYLRALCYIKLSKYDFALKDFARAIGENPNNAEYYADRGRLLYRSIKPPNPKDALRDLDRAIDFDPNNGKYYAVRGDIYEKLSLFIEALRDYDLAEKNNYHESDLWVGRASIYLMALQYEKALDCANHALNIDPQSGTGYRLRARAYSYLERYEDAEADYKQVMALMPDQYESAFDLCNYYQKRKNYELAGHYGLKALQMANSVPEVILSYANALANQERYSDAIGYYTRVIALRNDYATAYNNRGICYLNEQDPLQAEQDFRMALRFAPHMLMAHINIGILREGEGNLVEAVRHYSTAATYGAPEGMKMLEKIVARYPVDIILVDPIKEMRKHIMDAQTVTAMRQVVHRFPYMLDSDFEPLLKKLFSPEEKEDLQRNSRLDYLHLAIAESKSLYSL